MYADRPDIFQTGLAQFQFLLIGGVLILINVLR